MGQYLSKEIELDKIKNITLKDLIIKYKNNSIFKDSDLIVLETYFHLKDELENYKTISAKYPIMFDYLASAALYVLEEIEKDTNIAFEVHKKCLKEL